MGEHERFGRGEGQGATVRLGDASVETLGVADRDEGFAGRFTVVCGGDEAKPSPVQDGPGTVCLVNHRSPRRHGKPPRTVA